MTLPARPPRHGYSLLELLVVLGIVAVVFAMVVPRVATIQSGTSLRAARQQLATTFAAARGAALQKGQLSTLTLSASAATVTVRSGLTSTPVVVLGPVHFTQSVGVTVVPLAGAPSSVSYNARGLITPTPEVDVLRYELHFGSKRDTLCVSRAGFILSHRCQI
jgi:prepilin-type N-terminal cleavage/methylation domain-containing protein